jgi:hypothetical protein
MKKVIIALAAVATLALAACAGTSVQPDFNSPQVVFKGQ